MVLVAMCGLIATALGMLTNVAGLFFTPIADDFGIGRGSVSLGLTICNLVFAVGGLFTMRIVTAGRFRLTLLAGTVATAGATAALALSHGVVMLYVLNAVRGFAAGVLGIVLVTTVINNWFHRNSGLITSIAMGCSGLVGAALSPVLSAVIQSAGWRVGYLVCAALILLFNLPAVLLPIALRPEDVSLKPLGETEAASGTNAATASLVQPVLFGLALGYAVLASLLSAFPQHFPGLADAYALPASVGSAALSVCLVANTGGKLLCGALADRFGARRTLLLLGGLVAASVALMLAVHAGGALLIGAALLGFSYALATVGLVVFTKDVFGLENYGRVYPKLTLGTTVSNALGSSLVGFMFDASGAYTGALAMLLTAALAMLASVVAAYRLSAKQ